MLGALHRWMAKHGWRENGLPTTVSMLHDKIQSIQKCVTEDLQDTKRYQNDTGSKKLPWDQEDASFKGYTDCDPFKGKSLDLDRLVQEHVREIKLPEEGMKERRQMLGLDDLVL